MPTPRSPLFAAATADAPPRVLVIAELGVNHDGSVERAVRLVEEAANAGADAVKLQLFHPDRLLSNQARLAEYQVGKAPDPYELLAKLVLPLDAMRRVAEAARAHDLSFIVTPFSLDDAADARQLPLDAVKIASPDAVNPPLLDAAGALGVPMLISTGTCTPRELEPVAWRLRNHSAGGALLQCVSAYPTPDDAAALHGIPALRELFGLPVGYSDHTTSVLSGAFAVAAGALVVEKHLTHDRNAAGPDHAASLDAVRFREYVGYVRDAEAILGPAGKRVLPIERDVRGVSRQSVCAVRDLPAGHTLTPGDLTVKRPGTGIPAAQLDLLLRRTLARAVRRNDLLQPDDVEA